MDEAFVYPTCCGIRRCFFPLFE